MHRVVKYNALGNNYRQLQEVYRAELAKEGFEFTEKWFIKNQDVFWDSFDEERMERDVRNKYAIW
jgi:hypothetical protein